MSHIIIEIKAHCKNPEQIRKKLMSQKADFKGIDHQVDTYFKATNGRLKLREGQIENTLIHYHRTNQAGPKKSEVTLYYPNPNSSLKKILTDSIGILTIVDKQRAIYFIDNVKFHLDQVKDLGSFVEIEAIDMEGNLGEAFLLKQCERYMSLFGIEKRDLIKHSYSDMLLKV